MNFHLAVCFLSSRAITKRTRRALHRGTGELYTELWHSNPRVSQCRLRTYVLITLSRSPQSPPDVQMVSSLFTHPTSLQFFLFTAVIGTLCPCRACLQSSLRLPNRFIAFRDPPPSILLAEKLLTPSTAPRYLLH